MPETIGERLLEKSPWKMTLTNFVVGIDVLGAEELGAEGGLAHPRGSEKQHPAKWKDLMNVESLEEQC